MPEISEQAALYAIGALIGDERDDFERRRSRRLVRDHVQRRCSDGTGCAKNGDTDGIAHWPSATDRVGTIAGRKRAIRAAPTVAAISPSRRSSTPPWPGMKPDVSLTP